MSSINRATNSDRLASQEVNDEPSHNCGLVAHKMASAVENVLVELLAWIGSHSSYSTDQIALSEVLELTPERANA